MFGEHRRSVSPIRVISFGRPFFSHRTFGFFNFAIYRFSTLIEFVRPARNLGVSSPHYFLFRRPGSITGTLISFPTRIQAVSSIISPACSHGLGLWYKVHAIFNISDWPGSSNYPMENKRLRAAERGAPSRTRVTDKMLYGAEELTLDFRALLSRAEGSPSDKGVAPVVGGRAVRRAAELFRPVASSYLIVGRRNGRPRRRANGARVAGACFWLRYNGARRPAQCTIGQDDLFPPFIFQGIIIMASSEIYTQLPIRLVYRGDNNSSAAGRRASCPPALYYSSLSAG